jgi:hypothetical protein
MSVHWGGRGAAHINRLPRSIGQNPYSGATMLLDFTNPVLDPRITFSRGTNATLVDITGRITYAPANLLLRSQEFDNAAWANVSTGTVTVLADAAVAPDGTTTADRLTASAANVPQLGQAVALAAVPHIFSVWMRADTPTTVQLYDGGVLISSANVTTSWQRFSGLWTPAAGTRQPSLRLANNAVVFAWGAQLEQVTYQTTPGTYNATTASAYYGPRFDYDPVTLAPRGLLIEEARTNLLTYSAQFDDASWLKARASIVANTAVGPDGLTSADKLVEDTANNTHAVYKPSGIVSGTNTFSVYAKPDGRNWLCLETDTVNTRSFFNIATGTLGTIGSAVTATITPARDGWYRCTITGTFVGTMYIQTASSDGVAVYTGNGTSGILLYGAQAEAGAFATSYIPTVASTVSRSADVATMTGTNFSTWYNQSEGTFVASFDALVSANTTAANVLSAWQSFNDINRIWMWNGAPGVVRNTVNSGGVNSAELTGATIVANTPFRAAATYRVNDYAFATNGGTVATDASGALPVGINLLGIGQRGDTQEFLNGHIRAIAYYNTRLPNTQLQTLTAPSLASPLALDFLSTSYTVGY